MNEDNFKKLLKGMKWRFDEDGVVRVRDALGSKVSGWGDWAEFLKRGGEDQVVEDDGEFVVGVDPAGEDGDTSVVTVKAVKNRGQTPEETRAQERMPKRYFGKELHELSDEEVEAYLWTASINPEDRQELLDEVKLRAMKKGMELALALEERERERERATESVDAKNEEALGRMVEMVRTVLSP